MISTLRRRFKAPMTMRRSILLSVFLAGILLCPLPSIVQGATGGLSIRRVSADRWNFSPQRGEKVVIRYHLSQKARVTVQIFDGRDLLVRNVIKGKEQSPGDQAATWDGQDEGGKGVPPGLYSFTILARGEAGEETLFDLTDLTGGREQAALAITYDPGEKGVSYVLPKPGLVNIRYGLGDGGPILGTLLDWVPRPSGLNKEPWDGFDAQGVVYLGKNPKLELQTNAYTLNDNSIVVEGNAPLLRPQFIREMTWEKKIRERVRLPKKRMYDHWQHPRDRCRDPRLTLSFPGAPSDSQGLPVISGTAAIRMDVTEEDRKWMIGERFEIVIYVDMLFVYEEELGYTPFTWIWKPEGYNAGVHYVTVMLRGYEGHFGSVTSKVMVK